MIATYRKEKSLHGHSLDVLKSGLQKYIRRGNVEGAMYCAGELDCFSQCGKLGERIRTNMIHRLMIIYLEDVGLGGFYLWKSHIHPLVETWLKDRSNVWCLKHLIHLMCHAPKTRACSFAKAFAMNYANIHEWANSDGYEVAKEFKDAAFDEAVKAKSWAAILYYYKAIQTDESAATYKFLSSVLSSNKVPCTDIAVKWTKEIKTKERPIILLLPLLAHLFGCANYEPEVFDSYDNSWEKHMNLPVREFEDFVYDKHVRSGDKSRDFWLGTSSAVENEVFLLPQIFRDIYYRTNMVVAEKQPTFKKESDYKLVVRCQFVTTKAKTDTVLAKTPENKLIFLKGPFSDEQVIQTFLNLQEMKRARGLPTVNCRMEYLIADRWETTPLGLRNQLDLKKPWPFLICDTVFEEQDILTYTHSSKLWPETTVLDAKRMGLTIDPFALNEVQLKEYVDAIKFRIEHNLGDFADRNFLLGKDGHVYSVDEEVSSRPINLENQLGKRKYDLIRPFINPTPPPKQNRWKIQAMFDDE